MAFLNFVALNSYSGVDGGDAATGWSKKTREEQTLPQRKRERSLEKLPYSGRDSPMRTVSPKWLSMIGLERGGFDL